MSQKSLLLSLVILVVAGILIGFPRGWSRDRPAPLHRGRTPETALPGIRAVQQHIASLQQEIDIALLRQVKTLAEGLDVLSEGTGKDNTLPIIIDTGDFEADNPEAPDVKQLQIFFPKRIKTMARAAALRWLLSQVPTNNATYLVRQDGIKVTTLYAAAPEQLLRERALGAFSQQPLNAVLQELAAPVGLSVIVDKRVGEAINTPVSITFTNDVPLSSAFTALAEMAGLKFVVRQNLVYFTTPETAQLWEKADRERLQQKIELYKSQNMVGPYGYMDGPPMPLEEEPRRNPYQWRKGNPPGPGLGAPNLGI